MMDDHIPPAGRPDATTLTALPASGAPSQKFARLALAVALAALGAFTLQHYLAALAWAAVIAIGTWPLYQSAEQRWPPGRHHLLVPAVFTAAVGLLFLVPLIMVGVAVGQEAHGIAAWVHDARSSGIPVPAFVQHLPYFSGQAAGLWQTYLADPQAAGGLLERLDSGQVVSVSRRVGAEIAQRAVLFAFTLLTLFFLYKEGLVLTRQMLAASRRAFGPDGEHVGLQMVASVRGTVNGLVLVGVGEGILLGIAYGIAGAPHAALLGMFTAIAAMVPFGATVVFVLAALILLAQGSTTAAIIIIVFGFVVNFAADHAIRPALIGGATRLPFLWVLLGILGGIETWGLLGLFLGPAIMAALILLWREWTAG
jgi:predicted PurR-regulated permease PerM